MKKNNPGSISRQARRQAEKHSRRPAQRQKGLRLQAGRTQRDPQAPPQAGSYLVQQFWEHLNLGALLHRAGVKPKLKGLPAVTLMLVALMFGVFNAHSVSDLTAKAQVDPVLLEASWVQGLERKQLYRFLGQVRDENYLAWMGDIVRELNRDPRTALHRRGVVIGDDTVVFKFGKQMPYVTLVYKSSGQRFGLGNIIVSVHYADDHKDVGLFFDFWRPSPEHIQEAQDKRDRKKMKVDQRKPQDVARWIEHQVKTGHAPDLTILHGAQLGPVVVGTCDKLGLVWVAVASGRRQYTVERLNGTTISRATAQDLLKRSYRPDDWIELTDIGQRVVVVGQADLNEIGRVSLVVAENIEDQERQVWVMRADDVEALLPRLELALAPRLSADESRLQIMLRLLQRARQAEVPAETAVFDRWFYVPSFIQQVLAVGFARVILKAKRDIVYVYRDQPCTSDQVWTLVPDQRFRRRRLRGRWVKLASLRVYAPDLGQRVRLVLVKELGAHNKILQRYILMCTDPAFRPDQVYRAHKLRWKIEEFYREARQQHGFEAYHARDFNANFGHIALSFLSYLCVVVTRLLTPQLHDKTLGQVKQLVFGALVELDKTENELTVLFGPRFRRELGLPDYCT